LGEGGHGLWGRVWGIVLYRLLIRLNERLHAARFAVKRAAEERFTGRLKHLSSPVPHPITPSATRRGPKDDRKGLMAFRKAKVEAEKKLTQKRYDFFCCWVALLCPCLALLKSSSPRLCFAVI